MTCKCDAFNKYEGSDAEKFAADLVKLKINKDDWSILYRCKECGNFWEKILPHAEVHGGGPVELHLVTNEYVKGRYGIAV